MTTPTATDATSGQRPRRTISVLLTTMNAAPFVHSMLGSLAAQTRQPDEVVVHDAASSDETLTVVRRWEAVLNLTIVANTKRSTVGGSKQRALEAANGDLVITQDHDDALAADHLELLEMVHVDDTVIAAPHAFVWSPGGVTRPAREVWGTPQPPPGRELEFLAWHNWLTSCSLVDRARVLDAGGFRDESYVEDWDLWLRLMLSGARVARPETPTFYYRWGHANVSSDRSAVRAAERILLDRHADSLRQALGPEAYGRAQRRYAHRYAWDDTQALLRDGRSGRARITALRHLRGGDRRVAATALLPHRLVNRLMAPR